MKEKIGLLICGNSGVDYMDLKFPHKVIRSTLVIEKEEYEDFVDITAGEFYKKLEENPDLDISTSQVSTGHVAEVYEEFKKEGYTDVIAITVSSKLSGTYQGVVLAKDLVEGINVHVVDSRSISYGQMYLVYKAIEMIESGVKASKIEEDLNNLRGDINILVLVDTLKYLVKGGRLSSVSGFLGTLLKIKPLLKIVEDGRLIPYEKIRTTSKARKRMLEIILEEIKGKEVEMFLAYTNNKEESQKIIDEIHAIKGNENIKISLVPLTPVVGSHAGPGTIGIGYIVL